MSEKIQYTKKFLTLSEQIELLRNRGLRFDRKEETYIYKCLGNIGYSRLKLYFSPFLNYDSKGDVGCFLANVHFQDIINIYNFDRKLRLLLLEALNNIEVSLKSVFAYILGSEGSLYPHYKEKNFIKEALVKAPKRNKNGKIVVRNKKPVYEKSKHEYWLQGSRNTFRHEQWVAEYKRTYKNEPPIWLAVGTWYFSTLMDLFSILKGTYRKQIAKAYKLSSTLFENWFRTLKHIRNKCAHCSILWNQKLHSPMNISHNQPLPRELRHLRNHVGISSTMYAVVVIVNYFQSYISITQEQGKCWSDRMKHLWEKEFPTLPGNVNQKNAGFFKGWQNESIWRS